MAGRSRRRMLGGAFRHGRLNKFISSIILAAIVLVFVSVILVVFSGFEPAYSPITNKCISCHNDTGYPVDTDNDSVSAPYKRPHNNTIMCEICHGHDLHNISFIQPNGTYGGRSVSAGCLDCHTIKGLKENNSNFSSAPIIPPLKHSSHPTNGTIWGSYWNSSLNISSSCNYCHGETKHSVTAIGSVTYLLSGPNNVRNGSLNITTWCADCHLNGSNPNYRGNMWSPAPPLITVNNTGKNSWISHSTFLVGGYKDSNCIPCHALNGSYAATSLNYSHSLDVGTNGGKNCTSCHYIGSGYHNIDITTVNLSVHSGMNSQNATNAGVEAPNGACWACHDTDGNISNNPDSLVMGDIYNMPKKCDDCHLKGGAYYAQSVNWGGLTVSEHYFKGEGIKAGNSTSNISSCINCHENVSEMTLPNNDPDYGSFTGDGIRLTGGSRSFYHYGKPRPDLRIWDSGNAANCSYCHQNTSTAFTGAMLNASYNSSVQNHSLNLASPDCFNSTCHGSGWLHNSTLARPALSLPNSTFCQNCHVARQEHNGSVNCTECHVDTNSGDTIHPIKYIKSDGGFEKINTSAINCADCHQTKLPGFEGAPLIPAILKHSSHPLNGTIWDTYWNSSLNISSSCNYCHGDTKHNRTALGHVSDLMLDGNNKRNGSLSSTTWCADCHLNGSNSGYLGYIWSPDPPLITVNNTGKNSWISHSTFLTGGYKDSNCIPCHALNGSYAATSLNYSHSLDVGTNGGKNCTSCHYIGSVYHNIDITSAKLSVHSGMNAQNATNAGVEAPNGACWACHDTDGNISNNPDSLVMGDIYNMPKKCDDCHLQGGAYYAQSVNWGGLTVSEHYFKGEGIKAGNSTSNISSCINCHENVSEMTLPNNDPDYGSFTGDGIRLTGGNRSFYHYGKPRPDLRIWDSGNAANCSYCHQNTSTAFTGAMLNASYNSSVQNHSLNLASPDCFNSTCHGSGWLHNSTLARPALSLPDSMFCQKCHAMKQKHNGSVNCTNCHIDTASDDTIHPIKYLQKNRGKYSTSYVKNQVVHCTDCHQNLYTGFDTAPQIPNILKHSSNISNGRLWGSYWNSGEDSCYYCHGDTKHNITGLGILNDLLSDRNNSRKGTLTTTTWCADCHYDVTNNNYLGNSWLPAPPLITNDNTGKPRWVNHSGYLTGGYKDSVCKACHALNGSYMPTSSNYSHSLDEGIAGNPDCIKCHDLQTGLNAPVGINFTAANESVHAGMNSNNATSGGYPGIIGSCWACHDTDGNVTSGHPDRYKSPKTCDECHLGTGAYNTSAYNAMIVSEHFYSGTEIKAGNSNSNISSCINCHENITEMILPNNDSDTGTFFGDGVRLTGGNRSFYHYGRPRPDIRIWDSGNAANCSYCHQNTSTAFSRAMINASYNSSIQNHSLYLTSPDCFNSTCHGSGWLHNSTLARPALPLPNSTFCQNCHVEKQEHNSSVRCTECHIDTNSGDTIHPIKYIRNTGSFTASITSAVTCTGCHYTQFPNFPKVPIIPDLKHSNSLSSGRKWGNFWDNTSTITACYFCHRNNIHNASILGNVSLVKGSNTFNDPDLNSSMWCAACHYNNNTPSYKGDLIDPEPPEILNWSGKVPEYASDGSTKFYNHSEIRNYDDYHCKNCHGSMLPGYLEPTTLNFSHRVSIGGGGPDCISCHNRSATGSPLNLRVDGPAIKQGVHRNLNNNAPTSTTTDQINKACWACHGDGKEPSGHPPRYKSPRKCASSDCHSLSQSVYNEKMVYSHFRNASKNGNMGNATNYNVTTSADCQVCHLNSVVTKDDNKAIAIVSHYGSTDELVDSFNCRYCHMNKDNSEEWGGATLINRNRTALIEFEKERNKLSVAEGETIYLGEGYYLKLVEIMTTRDEALIQLIKGNRTVDETALPAGRLYKYETELTIDNSTVNTPVIMLNITSIFKGVKGFIQFEGSRIRKVHSERESRNDTNCFACHFSRYTGEKKRYLVIDREYKEDARDIIYYTSLFIDFKSDNKSKIYFADESSIIDQLLKGEKYISYPKLQKLLTEGETWNIADNYELKLREVSTESEMAWLNLTIDGAVVYDNIVRSGNWFNYSQEVAYRNDTKTNITVFTAKVSAISQGKKNFVVLSDVYAISPNILKTTSNSILFGYNGSWLMPGDTITTGRIPDNLHAPNLLTDKGSWGDCVKCHDTSLNLNITGIDAISTKLGKHSGLNRNASSKTHLSDNIDRACWACHTEGEEPGTHPPASIKARKCSSCHTYQEKPFYDAMYVGDEMHGLENDCENCHYRGSHNVIKFQVIPGITNVTFSPERPVKGDKVILFASAHSGYRMTIKAAEYYIDTIGRSGNGTPLYPVDLVFDSQKEEVTAEINTTDIPAGKHVIYIHAMERDIRWGEYYPVNLTIVETSIGSGILNKFRNTQYAQWLGIIYMMIVFIVAYFAIRGRRL